MTNSRPCCSEKRGILPGNQGHTLIMVAINSLTMLVLYGLLGGWPLGVNRMRACRTGKELANIPKPSGDCPKSL